MIYITGDTHGKLDIKKLNFKSFPQSRNLTKDDFLIITGDFGFVWYGNNEDKYWLKWFSNKPYTTLFIDGNHENFDLLNKYPIEYWKGGKVHKINESVFYLMRGQIFNIDGIKIFTFGGAQSTDIVYRKEHVSWWKEEMPDEKEYKEGIRNLEDNNYRVDYIVTHTCPSNVQQILLNEFNIDRGLTDLNRYLDYIQEKTEYKHWYFGHYHVDKKINEKHTCLFNTIVNIND